MSEEEIPKMPSAVLDVCPDMAGTEELRQVEQELRSRIENRKLRQYNIHFKGGSWRILETAKTHKLVIDFGAKRVGYGCRPIAGIA